MMSELGVNGANGDGDRGTSCFVIVVVVVVKMLFSKSSLPMSYEIVFNLFYIRPFLITKLTSKTST
jgi:hypothetical protein